VADGTANLIGALRKSMATTGYSDLKEFQRVEVVVAPYSGSPRADRLGVREVFRRPCARSCCARGGSACCCSPSSSRRCSPGSGSGSSARDRHEPAAPGRPSRCADRRVTRGQYCRAARRAAGRGRGSFVPGDFLVVSSRFNDGQEGTGSPASCASTASAASPDLARRRDRLGGDREAADAAASALDDAAGTALSSPGGSSPTRARAARHGRPPPR
jgi:hypothetical protein